MRNTGNIKIEQIDLSEALKYLGYGNHRPDEKTNELLFACMQDLLKVVDGKYIYKVFDLENGQIPNLQFMLEGQDVKEHLKKCEKIIFLCVTISSGVDLLIRKKQITGMTEGMMTDSLASVAVEQVCDLAQEQILSQFSGYEQTFRFGLGYGDFPLSGQKSFLEI